MTSELPAPAEAPARGHTRSDAALTVAGAFVAGRAVTLVAMLASLHARGTVSATALRDAFVHWDAISYLDIAAHGYPAHLDYHDAFLPGYPLLIRAISPLAGNTVVAGVLVSALAELVALRAVHELVLRERDARAARFAVWALALVPFGIFLSGVYTESCFLAATAVSLVLLRRGDARGASLAAACALAFRLTGLVLIAVIAFELLRRRQPRRLLWVVVVPVPLLAFAVYLRLHTGDTLALVHAEALPSFGEGTAWPWSGFLTTLDTAAHSTDPSNTAIFERELAAGVVGLLVVLAVWWDRGVPSSLALYCTLVWLTAVSLTFWRSVPRYDLALFPALLAVVDLTRRARALRPVLLVAGALGLAWSAYVFAEGGWVG